MQERKKDLLKDLQTNTGNAVYDAKIAVMQF